MQIAVIIPAFNEAVTIREVIRDFHAALPEASICVVDNNSTDGTGDLAREALRASGCRGETLFAGRPGKANAVRRALRSVEADVYLLVDADRTYAAAEAERLIAPVRDGAAEIVVGDRLSGGAYDRQNERRFHAFGNRLVCGLINLLFRSNLKDIMSGYRALSRSFVKNFPILHEGFELETEMTLHALDRRAEMREIPISYNPRPTGSHSKLNTLQDGMRIVRTVFWIFRQYRPFAFFGFFAGLFMLCALAAGARPVYEFFAYSYVYRVPSAILAAGLAICAVVSLAIGLILDTVVGYQRALYEKQMLDYAGRRDRVGR